VVHNVPSFAANYSSKGYFYDRTGDYVWYPSEQTFIRRRGPGFSEVFNRYDVRIDKVQGGISVVVPNHPAPGKPWVFRADFANPASDIDIKLLSYGYHIVTGPVTTSNDGPLLNDWTVAYNYLVEHGFSKKAVVGGVGGAAGESYQWAVLNPEKVSCIFVVNPLLRSVSAQVQPLNNLAPLANAKVPILHLVDEKNPALSNTYNAERRYKGLGGSFTIVSVPSEAHIFPLSDPRPIIEFLNKHNR